MITVFNGFYMVLQGNSKNTKVLLWYISKLYSITMVLCPKTLFLVVFNPLKLHKLHANL